MAKGENIFRRKDGRWEARYIKERDLNGKIRYGYCYGKTYREAKEKVNVKRMNYQQGESSDSRKERMNFYCDQWLQIHRAKVKESTYVKYHGFVNHYIKAYLGDLYADEVTDEKLQSFTQILLKEHHLSAKTTKDILVVLKSVFLYLQKQYVGKIQLPTIEYPRVERKEIRILTQEEQTCLLQYLLKDMDTCKFGIILALTTGLRIGEICALKWKDISLTEGTISVRGSMQRLQSVESSEHAKTKIIIGSPKSDSSLRIIPMTKTMIDLCRNMLPDNPNAYILTGNERFMEPRALQYRLKKYTAQCGLQGIHFHTLRHTFATRCIEAGFEIKSLSEVLGHSSTAVTMDRYVHSSLELKRSNMEKTAFILNV